MNITLTGDILTLIGPALRRICQSQGKTLKDMSETIGCSVSHVSEVERGVHGVSVEMLAAWTDALGHRLMIGFEVKR